VGFISISSITQPKARVISGARSGHFAVFELNSRNFSKNSEIFRKNCRIFLKDSEIPLKYCRIFLKNREI